jgi:phospholipid/cholesterol/gamma-HCH transport system substrate-binding protein
MEKLGGVADDLKVLTSSLTTDGGGEDLRAIITNFKDLSQSLKELTAENGPGLTKTLASIGQVADNLEQITYRLNNGQGALGQLINDSSLTDELKSTLTSLKDITAKISKGEGSLGRLVNDETTIDKIDEVLTGINDYLEKGDSLQVSLEYRGDYMTRYDYLKSTIGLKLQTSPDRYYLLGVTGDYFGLHSRTDYSSQGNTWQRENWDRGKLKINAQIAQRYYDAVIRGGIFESGAGLGLDYYMLEDNLRLTFEAFSGDFDHNPHLRVMASYRFWKILYAGAGYDDFISDQHRASPFISFGFYFTDDDLKYILSGATSFISK